MKTMPEKQEWKYGFSVNHAYLLIEYKKMCAIYEVNINKYTCPKIK